jgi:hypothetical protein
MRQLIFSPLASIGSDNFIYDYAADKWSLNEDAVHHLFCDVSNSMEPMPKNMEKGIRVIPYNPWREHPYGLSSQFQPYEMNVDRTKFILKKRNTWYTPLVRKYFEIAGLYGLFTKFCLGDNCQFAGNYDKWCPWSNNEEGIGSFYESRAWPLFKTWFEECLEDFKGLNMQWAWFNEGAKGSIEVAKNAIIPVILERKLDWSIMSYGATMDDVNYEPKPAGWIPTPEKKEWDYYPGMAGTLDWLKKLVADTIGGKEGDKAKLKIWKEVHSIGGKGYPKIPNRLDQSLYWWARPKAKRNNDGVIPLSPSSLKVLWEKFKLLLTSPGDIRIAWSNDGVFDGNSKCDFDADDPSHTRPDADRMAETVGLTLRYSNDFSYEHLPKTKDIVCITATLSAMYKVLAGKDSVPKYTYTSPPAPEPTPEPEPEPGPVPVPKCTCSGWLWKGDFKRWWNCLFHKGDKYCK